MRMRRLGLVILIGAFGLGLVTTSVLADSTNDAQTTDLKNHTSWLFDRIEGDFTSVRTSIIGQIDTDAIWVRDELTARLWNGAGDGSNDGTNDLRDRIIKLEGEVADLDAKLDTIIELLETPQGLREGWNRK